MGVPRWEKVDKLTRALMSLDGVSVSSSEAAEIVHLYNALEEYNRPVFFKLRPSPPARGDLQRARELVTPVLTT